MTTRDIQPNMVFDGRYRIVRRVGLGGMAAVYCAQDETLGRQVAIKVLDERYARDAQFVERFLREASAAARLNHPNIVQVYDRGEYDGTYYIAMEFVDGTTLKDIIIRRAPLSEEEVLSYARQALNALRFAHRNGVVHRDVKPHNMMVDREGRLKIADFGIARAGADHGLTEVGSIVGTAQYVSPEQARGHTVSASSDLYSLGVVMFEMATGHVPFDGDSPVSVALRHVNDPVPSPRASNPQVSTSLEAVIVRAMEKDPSTRYQTADDMVEDLDRLRRGAQPTSHTLAVTRTIRRPDIADAQDIAVSPFGEGRMTPPSPPPPAYSRSSYATDNPHTREPQRDGTQRRRRWPWILLAVILLGAGGAAAWIGLGGHAKTSSVATVVIPDVTGMRQAAAERALNNKGFDSIQITREASDSATEGTVMSQDPASGDRAATDTTVTLTVSSGAQPVDVPTVTDTPYDEAKKTLELAGFTVTRTDKADDKVKVDTVISQDPAGGDSAHKGATIALTVSTGPEKQSVPDVVGRTTNDARSTLLAAGFQVSVDKSTDGPTPENQVISQDPTPGSNATKGDTVTVSVGTGYNVVPDVSGKTEGEATSTLEDAGYLVKITDESSSDPALPADGQVTAQDPATDTRYKIGYTVTITVSKPATP